MIKTFSYGQRPHRTYKKKVKKKVSNKMKQENGKARIKRKVEKKRRKSLSSSPAFQLFYIGSTWSPLLAFVLPCVCVLCLAFLHLLNYIPVVTWCVYLSCFHLFSRFTFFPPLFYLLFHFPIAFLSLLHYPFSLLPPFTNCNNFTCCLPLP